MSDRRAKIMAYALLLAIALFWAKPAFADTPAEIFLPDATSYHKGIDNLPQWERIIAFYKEANLEKPSPEFQKWWEFIWSIKSDSPIDQIDKVNNWLNKYPYKQDNWIYGREDHWATPSEFLENGGDCEDFAIIKYLTLRRLGFRAEQMKISMVYDIFSGTDHSFLVVKYGDQDLILDSRERDMSPENYKKRFHAHYAFNENGVWTYPSPKIAEKTINGSATQIIPGNR